MIKKRFINEFTVWDAMNEARASIDRVRELHKSVIDNNAGCGNPDCCGEYEEWEACADCQCDYPCPTIQALDGDTNE